MTTAPANDPQRRLLRLYDALARWQWRRRGAAPAGQGLELHKRLAAPPPGGEGPAAGVAGLHDWLWQFAGLRDDQAVLDLGCGFGATLLRWAQAHPGRFVGLTPCAFQIEQARAQAQALGVAARCSFVCQPALAPYAGVFDAVVAVESLGHVDDLAGVLRRVHGWLRPGGVLVVVDDLRHGIEPTDADLQALARHWCSPPLRSRDEWWAALACAGLEPVREHDLSVQVRRRSRWSCRIAATLLSLATVLPIAPARRAVAAAFAGGGFLDALHARRAARYLAIAARRPPVGLA